MNESKFREVKAILQKSLLIQKFRLKMPYEKKTNDEKVVLLEKELEYLVQIKKGMCRARRQECGD